MHTVRWKKKEEIFPHGREQRVRGVPNRKREKKGDLAGVFERRKRKGNILEGPGLDRAEKGGKKKEKSGRDSL